MIFSAIEDAVLNGKADLGVIIHENRFTYQEKGLHKVQDLGEYWEQQMNAPIPLGAIAIKEKIRSGGGKSEQPHKAKLAICLCKISVYYRLCKATFTGNERGSDAPAY